MTRPEIEVNQEEFRNPIESRVVTALRENSLVTVGEISRHPETHYPKDGTTVERTEVSITIQDGGNEGMLLSELDRVMRFPGRITTFERAGDKFNRVDVLLVPGVEAEL